MKLIIYDKVAAARIVTILIFLSLTAVPGNLISKPLSQEEIRPAVETWVRYVTADARPDAIVESMEPYVADGIIVAYIAYLADSGFCICGADDRLLPVYVYSPGGIYDPGNEVYKYFLEEMTLLMNRIDELQRSGDADMSKYSAILDDRARYWSDLASGIISIKDRGLYDGPDQLTLDVTSVWYQGFPYNYYCPTLPPNDPDGDRCVTGCVATAMAGIMRYWEWPVTGVGIGSTNYHYQWRSNWDSENLTHDPSVPVDWWGGDRLEWIPDDGGLLRMNGYWDSSLYGAATNIVPKYILAGTSNGAFFSTDNGNNWNETSNGLTNTNIQALAVNSTDRFFAGTYGDGIFRSTNYGGYWWQKNDGLSYHLNIQAFTVNSDDDIFVGILGDGVYRSTNNGDLWEHTSTGLTNLDVQTLAVNSNNDLFAGTDGGGVFRSTNNGDSWESGVSNPTDLDIQTLAVNSNNDLFAGTDGGGVFRSVDNGDSWDPVNVGLTNLDVQTLAVNSRNYLFAGTFGGGVFRSTDNGNNWVHVYTGLTSNNIKDIAVNSKNDLFAATGLGVFRSTNNGNTWEQKNDGLTELDVKALAIPPCHQIAQDYLAALDLLYNRLTPEEEPLDVDFSTATYRWDLIKDIHWNDPDVDDSDMAVATLCYHTGLSVEMGYGVAGSGAGSGPAPFINNFLYDDDALHVALELGDYGAGINEMMDEIQWLRPVQYDAPPGEGAHAWIIFAYNRTFLPDSIQWGMNSGNFSIDWCSFSPIYTMHRFVRYIAPESVVRFVGSDVSGDGSPADPYLNIEEAIANAPSGTTLIFKAGSDNTFSAAPLEIHNKQLILRGKGAVIRKESP